MLPKTNELLSWHMYPADGGGGGVRGGGGSGGGERLKKQISERSSRRQGYQTML